MPSLLMVPVKLDALLLEHDHTVVTAAADFTALPYNDGRRDVNADTANLSENILAQPFENQTLTLKAGLHPQPWVVESDAVRRREGGSPPPWPHPGCRSARRPSRHLRSSAGRIALRSWAEGAAGCASRCPGR